MPLVNNKYFVASCLFVCLQQKIKYNTYNKRDFALLLSEQTTTVSNYCHRPLTKRKKLFLLAATLSPAKLVP